jgi:TPP-dependent pyruvate/acetoin dehydrogenase alpha subunit
MIKIDVGPTGPATAANSLEIGLTTYRKLLLVREAEEAILRYYPEDEMKSPMHMSMGQEAGSVGVCVALGDRGQIFATYRSHAAFLARTENAHAFFAELYGRVTGPAQGKGGSMHLSLPAEGHICSSAIVASCLPLAVGAAFAYRSRRENKISCVFFGDGALDEGAFWESINTACVMKLPVLFVCEDNEWAVHTGRNARAGYDSIVGVVRKTRCLAESLDTNDAEKIAAVTSDLVARAQQAQTPAFLQLKCCRYLEHVGINSDLDAGYRSKAEVDRWRARDAIDGQRQRLRERGLPESVLLDLEAEVRTQVEAAVTAAKKAAPPGARELLEGVLS